jgi:hypothetical protein
MPLPGSELNVRALAGGSGDPSDTGAAFWIGRVPRGPMIGEVNTYQKLVETFGEKPTNGTFYEAAEAAFNAGLARLFVLRLVGDDAAPATATLAGTPSGTALTWTASSVGAWGNDVDIDVVDTGNSTVRIVFRLDGKILEQTPICSTRDELLSWSTTSARFGTLTPGATATLPVVAAGVSAAGGTDDAPGIDEASYAPTLERITRDHPVGQLAAPGVYHETVHLALAEKASDPADGRFAVLDADPSMTADQIEAHANVLKASGFPFWTLCPQRIRVPAPGGGLRYVPGSAMWCARAAATDAVAGPGQAPAGEGYGEAPGVMLDVERTFTESERERLNLAGVTVFQRINGVPRIYGARSGADPTAQEAWKWVTGCRVTMRVARRGRDILESFVLRRIDGRRSALTEAGMALETMLEEERAAGNVYGEEPGQGFEVDTGYGSGRPNNQDTIREGMLNGRAGFDVPGIAERVRLDLGVSPAGTTTN